MRIRILSLAFAAFVAIGGPADAALIAFSDRAAFEAAATGLVTEGFEAAFIDPDEGNAEHLTGPLSSATDNAFFSPGDIVEGLAIDTPRGFLDLYMSGPGGDAATTTVGNSATGTPLQILLTGGGVTAIGMDLFNHHFKDGDKEISVLGPSGLLGAFTVTALTDGIPTFFGVLSTDGEITALDILHLGGDPQANFVRVDDISFGAATTATAVPEPSAVALLGVGLVGLGVVRRRRA